MRILFAVKPHLPAIGGAQLTVHWLALGLQRRGHEVAVLARSSPHPVERATSPTQALPPTRDSWGTTAGDRDLGYPLIVAPQPERVLAGLAEDFRADVVVVGAYDDGCARSTRLLMRAASPRPAILHVHDAAGAPLAGERALGAGGVVAVSEHVRTLVAAHGVAARVSLPALERSRYRIVSGRRTALLVNPVPQKGVERVLALATARPDVPFALALAWQVPLGYVARLRARARQLGNVELRPRTHDPAQLYGDTRLLLAPSPYPEAWGRVVTEAQASGIPALAARSGGLPEAVGAGGVVVDPAASDEAWLAAFSRIWDDTENYARLAAAADREGRRRELTLDAAAAAFERALDAAVERPARAADESAPAVKGPARAVTGPARAVEGPGGRSPMTPTLVRRHAHGG
jgi:glycosyltransferase involved in cell wall biosynthesis